MLMQQANFDEILIGLGDFNDGTRMGVRGPPGNSSPRPKKSISTSIRLCKRSARRVAKGTLN